MLSELAAQLIRGSQTVLVVFTEKGFLEYNYKRAWCMSERLPAGRVLRRSVRERTQRRAEADVLDLEHCLVSGDTPSSLVSALGPALSLCLYKGVCINALSICV